VSLSHESPHLKKSFFANHFPMKEFSEVALFPSKKSNFILSPNNILGDYAHNSNAIVLVPIANFGISSEERMHEHGY